MQTIGFGGGCHWYTEAVFDSLRGVASVKQGWITPKSIDAYSEAVLLRYDPKIIPLRILIHIHILTHNSTSNHSMRSKYRSAVYVIDDITMEKSNTILQELQTEFDKELVTKVYEFGGFLPSPKKYRKYYQKHATKGFCRTYIDPKLALLREQFNAYYDGQLSI